MNPLDQRWQAVRDRWPIRVKNGAGVVIPPFSLVLITSSTSSNNEQLHTVVKPNAASTDFPLDEYLVTGPFAIGAGSSNEGLATTLVQPNYLSTDAAAALGQVWGPKHGQFTAARYYYGYEILGGATTYNGVNIALARWVGRNRVIGKTDSSHAKSASGTVSVYAGALGSESDTTMNITAYNRFAAVATTKWVACVYTSGGWDIIAAEC